MVTKKISIPLGLYTKLKEYGKPDESFAATIQRIIEHSSCRARRYNKLNVEGLTWHQNLERTSKDN